MRVDQVVHVVEDQPDRLWQTGQGGGELRDELRLGSGPPDPRGLPPAGTRHGRAAGHRGHHRGPQPPRIVVARIEADPRRVHRGAGLRPVRQQQRLPVAGRRADQCDVGGRARVQVGAQVRACHELGRQPRHRDLDLRDEHHRHQAPAARPPRGLGNRSRHIWFRVWRSLRLVLAGGGVHRPKTARSNRRGSLGVTAVTAVGGSAHPDRATPGWRRRCSVCSQGSGCRRR